jgi:hypothetical protein
MWLLLLCAPLVAQALLPREQILSAVSHPERRHDHSHEWTTDDGSEFSISSSFTLHDDVQVSDAGDVTRRLSSAPLPNLSGAVKAGRVDVTYKPAPTHSQLQGGRKLETTTYCNDR